MTRTLRCILRDYSFLLGALALIPFFSILIWAGHYPHEEPIPEGPFLSFWGNTLLLVYVFFWGGWCVWDRHRKYLTQRSSALNECILVLAALSLTTWMYKPWYSMLINILVCVLALIHALRNNQFYKPHPIMIALGIYGLIQFAGLLWSPDLRIGLRVAQTQISFVLFPLISCCYRARRNEVNRFLHTTLELLLLVLTVSTVAYLMTIAQTGDSLGACLTFNKNYFTNFPHIYVYDFLLRWSTLIQPTFMTWVYVIIAGCMYVVMRQQKERLKTWITWAVYMILMFWFVFANQTRYGILAYGILFGLIGLYELLHYAGKRTTLWLLLPLSLCIVFALTKASSSSFFTDSTRTLLYDKGLGAIHTHPYFGMGTGGERVLLDGFKIYLHNDYLSAYVNHGFIGFVSLLSWIGISIYYIQRDRNASLFFFLVFTLILMMLDSVFNAMHGVCIITLFLLLTHTEEASLGPKE